LKLSSKAVFNAPQGSVLRIATPGGGGWGKARIQDSGFRDKRSAGPLFRPGASPVVAQVPLSGPAASSVVAQVPPFGPAASPVVAQVPLSGPAAFQTQPAKGNTQWSVVGRS
jgi:hypothetical protein